MVLSAPAFRGEVCKHTASTLVLDDLAEATEHASVVGLGVKLDTGLDAVLMSMSARELFLVCMRKCPSCVRDVVVGLGMTPRGFCFQTAPR